MKIVALHGWLSDSSVYASLVEYLDVERYTVAFLDFRGYGSSSASPGDFGVAEMAGDVLSEADRLGWSTFHVMGHSMGGMVLQWIALAAPGRLLSSVAITPVPASGFPLDSATSEQFRSAALDDAALESIFDALTGHRHGRCVLRNWRERTRAQTTRSAFLGYLSTWTSTDFADKLATVDLRVLVVSGAHDGPLGPAYQTKTTLVQLPNPEHVVIAAAGHYPMLETPAELATVVDSFLQKWAG